MALSAKYQALRKYYFYKIYTPEPEQTINAITSIDCSAWKGFKDSNGTTWYVYPVEDSSVQEDILDNIDKDNKVYFMDINENVSDKDKLLQLIGAHEFINFHEAVAKEKRE